VKNKVEVTSIETLHLEPDLDGSDDLTGADEQVNEAGEQEDAAVTAFEDFFLAMETKKKIKRDLTNFPGDPRAWQTSEIIENPQGKTKLLN
jgi:hypothetical protein